MSSSDVAEISIIIDDHNKTSFKVDLNSFNEEMLSAVCNELSNQYHLSGKAIEKIYCQTLIEITNARNTLYNTKVISNSNNEKTNGLVDRLYYQGTKKKKEREKDNERLLQEKIDNEIKQYSFCPNDYENRKANNNNMGEGCNRNRNNTVIHAKRNTANSNRNKIMREDIANKKEKKKCNRKKELCSYDTFTLDLRTKCETTTHNNTNTNSNINTYANTNSNNNQNANTRNNHNHSGNGKSKQSKLNNFNKSTKHYKDNSNPQLVIVNSNSNKWYNRLHNTQKVFQSKKEQMINRFYEFQCPFEPKLSKGSLKIMEKRIESPDEINKRLSSSKLYSSLSKSLKAMNNIKTESNSNNTLTINTITQSKHHSNTNIHKSFSLSSIKSKTSHFNRNCSFLSTSNKKVNHSAKTLNTNYSHKTLPNEPHIDKVINDIASSKANDLKYYQSTINQSTLRYKTNTIKDIYEILTSNEEVGIDFNALSSHGIPKHIIDKVVIPTCYTINNKHLDFNFQTFYSIAIDILNKYF